VAVAGRGVFELSLTDRIVRANAPFIVSAGIAAAGSVRVAVARVSYHCGVRGIAVPPELGTDTTHLVSAMGGIAGRAWRPVNASAPAHTDTSQRQALAPQNAVVPLPEHHVQIP